MWSDSHYFLVWIGFTLFFSVNWIHTIFIVNQIQTISCILVLWQSHQWCQWTDDVLWLEHYFPQPHCENCYTMNFGGNYGCVCVCVCLGHWLKGLWVVKHAIPISNSSPLWHPFHTLKLSSTTPRDPHRGMHKGIPMSPCILVWTPWPQLGGCSTT